LTEREERSAVAIASNEPFSGWTKTFTDPRLCAAIVDRLTSNRTIIETGIDSYRLATHWPNNRPAKPPPGSSMCARAGWHAGGSVDSHEVTRVTLLTMLEVTRVT